MSKVVVLLSGGLDSSTLLYQKVKQGNDVYPISFNYGQKHRKELIAARNICESLGEEMLLRYKGVDLTSVGKLLPSALTGVGEVPNGHYEDESMKATVVPNRNMILLSIAAGYAQGIGAKFVSYAAHSGDHAIYPDCRPEFFNSCGETIDLATGGAVRLEAPFIKMTKADIVRLGTELKVPYFMTWSCYQGGDKHCGLCGTDIERRLAFIEANVKDPTEYENPLPERYKR